jgi:hypothetical protein
MNAQLNLFVAWLWIMLGFVSGFYLGLNFHKETWLGGYSSFKRRLYRLAHISFFGLGAVNFIFYFTAQKFLLATVNAQIAGWGFVAGAISMPICCVLMAHHARLRALFLIPVGSLSTAGTCTLLEVIKL